MKDHWRDYDVSYSLITNLLQTAEIKGEDFASYGRSVSIFRVHSFSPSHIDAVVDETQKMLGGLRASMEPLKPTSVKNHGPCFDDSTLKIRYHGAAWGTSMS
jgi:hypothetical protein